MRVVVALALLFGTTGAFVPRTARIAPRRRHARAAPMMAEPRTLFDKIWDSHQVVPGTEDKAALIYIDRHLVHEVTSPQAFEGLRIAKRSVRRPDCTLCTVDHNVPTDTDRATLDTVEKFIEEVASRTQVLQLEQNVEDFNLVYFGMEDARQGIVHIIGPEQGFTLPGSTTVCGDSHTATHGAFGSLAFGIGTSEVEHVLATQTLPQTKGKNMLVRVDGELTPGVTSKDIVLHVCGLIGTAGGTGSVIEFAGSAIESLSMEARMSISNMAIEAGARAGVIAPDDITFDYLKGRPMCPTGAEWDAAVASWRELKSDEGAKYDRVVEIAAADIAPTVTWGTSPQDVTSIEGTVPIPDDPARGGSADPARQAGIKRSLEYMGLEGGERMQDLKVDKVFIGSCTNGRIEDMRAAAAVARGRKVADNVALAMVVPGSGLVKQQAEAEGLDVVFEEAGFEWREPGCSMCLAMNTDKLKPQERCASTSNRNFEGRQGNGGRTHLVSPAMAAAAAVAGTLADVRVLPPLGEAADLANADAEAVAAKAAIDEFAAMAPAFARVFGGGGVDMDVKPSAGAMISPMAPYLAAECEAGEATPEECGEEGADAGAPKAGMPPFVTVSGVAAPLDVQNIDTDMIIPKEYLKTIKRSGLGYAAFAELRYHNADEVAKAGPDAAQLRDDFVLNQPGYDGGATTVLIAGDNFGCGSSREHAPWSILDLGIRCIVSTSFADIFFNNCFNNGMLPICLPREQVEALLEDAATPGTSLTIDLPRQVIVRPDGKGEFAFEVEPARKENLLKGLDAIGLTLEQEATIAAFEAKRSVETPWLDGATSRVPDVVPMYPEAPSWQTA